MYISGIKTIPSWVLRVLSRQRTNSRLYLFLTLKYQKKTTLAKLMFAHWSMWSVFVRVETGNRFNWLCGGCCGPIALGKKLFGFHALARHRRVKQALTGVGGVHLDLRSDLGWSDLGRKLRCKWQEGVFEPWVLVCQKSQCKEIFTAAAPGLWNEEKNSQCRSHICHR